MQKANYPVVVFDMSGTLLNEVSGNVYPGIGQLLKDLHENDVQLAIATNMGRRSLDHFLENTGYSKYFSTLCHVDKVIPKPNPEMMYMVMDECAVQASDMIMVGDSLGDLRCAHAARVKCCMVSWDVPFYAEILAQQPDFAVTTVDELRKILLK